MYTTILTDDDNIQIKTGNDNCDVYRVGDEIKWNPSHWTPGESPNGVHSGWSEKGNGETVWVIIKDYKVHAVIPNSGAPYEDVKLWKLYCINYPADSLWTEAQWARHGRNTVMYKRLSNMQDCCYGLNEEECGQVKAYAGATTFTRSMLRQTSIAPSLFPPKPVTTSTP